MLLIEQRYEDADQDQMVGSCGSGGARQQGRRATFDRPADGRGVRAQTITSNVHQISPASPTSIITLITELWAPPSPVSSKKTPFRRVEAEAEERSLEERLPGERPDLGAAIERADLVDGLAAGEELQDLATERE